MHRLKSPFVALVAMLILAGPLLGRVSQIDPGDIYQVSTPSAWERSTQETVPIAEPAYRFDHSGGSRGTGPSSRTSLSDGIVLASPTGVAYVQRSTMTVGWELQPTFEILGVSAWDLEDSPLILLSGETNCTSINAETGDTNWENTDCPAGWFSPQDNGTIIHYSYDGEQQTVRLLDTATGEESWSYSYMPASGLSSTDRMSSDSKIVYFYTTTSVDAVSMTTGEVLWSAPIAAEKGILLLESYLLVLRNEEIIALDPATGDEIWLSFMEPGYYTDTTFAQREPDEKLLVSLDSAVVILDLSTGLEVARYEDAAVETAYYTDQDGQNVYPAVFMVRIGNDAVGIEWETLDEAWRVSNAGDVSFDWTYNDIKTVLTSDARMLLIDIQTGDILLTLATDTYSSARDGDILVFRFEGRIEAYDTVAKRKLWTYSPPAELRRVASTDDHVAVTTPYRVYILDAQTGEVVSERAHPEYWESYRNTSRFIVYWDGISVSVVHHLTGTTTQIDGIYTFEDLSVSSSGDVRYFRYSSTLTLIDGETGRQLFSSESVVNMYESRGEFAVLTSGNRSNTLQLVEPSGEIRWQIDVPAESTEIVRNTEASKIVLRGRTSALLIDLQTGEIIMEIPISYNPDAENDSLYLSPADAVLVGSDAETVIYQVPAAEEAQLAEDTVIRGAPSASGVERGTFPAGTPVFPTGNVRERSDGLWIEVRIEDITGWVHESSVSGGAATPVASP